MIAEWVRSFLDLVLIGSVAVGIVQATRLLRNLNTLRESQGEMARFVQDFNSSVLRAETSIRNLKTTARESGDDLEKLLDKSGMVRDELQFLCESADQLAERLTNTASKVTNTPRPETAKTTPEPRAGDAKPPQEARQEARPSAPAAKQQNQAEPQTTEPDNAGRPTSRAERDLLRALQNLT